MENSTIIIGSAAVFLLATSCWPPWLALAFGGGAGLSSLSRIGKMERLVHGARHCIGSLVGLVILAEKKGRSCNRKHCATKQAHLSGLWFSKNREHTHCGAYKFFYGCEKCHSLFKSKTGDCCVFCSYGDVKYPSMQVGHECC